MSKKSRKRRRNLRDNKWLGMERLEDRLMLTASSGASPHTDVSPWHNATDPFDVNADGRRSIADLRVLLTDYLENGARELGGGDSDVGYYVDITGDGWATLSDMRQLLQTLTAPVASAEGVPNSTSNVANTNGENLLFVEFGYLPGGAGDEVIVQTDFSSVPDAFDEVGTFIITPDLVDSNGALLQPPAERIFPLFQRGAATFAVSPTFDGAQRLGVYAKVDDSHPDSAIRVVPESIASWKVQWEEQLQLWSSLPEVGDRGYDDGEFHVTATVVDANRPPEFVTEPVTAAHADIPYEYDSDAVDPDQDELTYRLAAGPAGMSIDPRTGRVMWRPSAGQVGVHSVVLEVADGARSDIQQYDIVVAQTPSNRPPVILSSPVRSAYLGEPVVTEPETPVDLRDWQVIQYDMGIWRDAEWIVSNDGTSVRQLHNSDAAILLSDFTLTNTKVEGTWLMDGGDDDMVGFVFGYQDTGHFYLFDWKRNTQSRQGNRSLGNAEQGMTVRAISVEDGNLDALDIWPTAGNGARSRTLFHNDVRWNHNTEYRFSLEFHPGEFTITVSIGDTVLEAATIEDDTYTSGGFGFYNFSQDNAVYRGFTSQAVPDDRYVYDVEAIDPDSDPLTYELVESPEGMTISPANGLVSWVPDDTHLGNHRVVVRVRDGRGGEAIQDFIVCVHPDPTNHAPLIVSEPARRFLQGPANDISVYRYDVEAIDFDFDTLRYELDAAPSGATINNETGEIQWPMVNGEQFVPVDFSQFHNLRLQAIPLPTGVHPNAFQYPEGSFETDGIPFEIPAGGNNAWFASGQNGSLSQVEIPVGEFGVSEVHTLINSGWGSPQIPGLAAVEFVGSDGAFYRKELVGNVDIRDYNQGVFTNSINGTSTVNVFTAGSGQNQEARLDKQFFDLPADFKSQVLETIRFIDNGAEGIQRIFVAGVTVLAAPSQATFEIQVTDGRGGLDQQSFTLDVMEAGDGEIHGTKFNDSDGDGHFVRHQAEEFSGGPGAWSPDGASLHYIQTGGNPGGYLELRDVVNTQLSLSVDSEIVNHLDAYDGGTLAFDARSINGIVEPWNVFGRIEIRSASKDLVYDGIGAVPGSDWSTFSIGLSSTEWGVSQNEWLEALDTATAMEITLEADLRLREHVGFDNFQLTPWRQEEGMEGWRIYLDENNNGMWESWERSTTTDASGAYAFTDLPDGDYTVREVARKGWQQTHPEFERRIAIQGGNVVDRVDFGNLAVPVTSVYFTSFPTTTVEAGQRFVYEAHIVSSSGEVTIELPLAPQGMSIHPTTGVVVWDPSDLDVGTHQVALRAVAEDGEVITQPFQLTVEPFNAPPVFESIPPAAVGIGQPLEFNVRAFDPDGDTAGLRFANPTLGNGLVVDPISGHATWTAPISTGPQTLSIVATDEQGGESTLSFTVAVLDGINSPPLFTSTPRTSTAVNVPWHYIPDATDPDDEPLTVSIEFGPNEAILTDMGVIQWTPTSPGTVTFVVRATDSRGEHVEQTFDVTATLEFENSAPIILSESVPTQAAYNLTQQFQILASDPDNDSVQWRLESGPTGMGMDQRGNVRWTPDESLLGPQEFIVVVSDAYGGTSEATFTIEVTCANGSPQVISTPVTNSTEREPYRYTIDAVDPEHDELRFLLETMPTGMAVDETTGEISWLPNVGQAGLHLIEVAVVDSHGAVGRQSFEIEVDSLPLGEDPQAILTINEPPRITSTPVFGAQPGESYTYQVEAFDPEGTSLAYGFLSNPQGMAISPAGEVTWTPPLNGPTTESVSIVVEDADGAKGFQTFTLRIEENRSPVITSFPVDTVSAGGAYAYDFRALDPDNHRLTFSITGPSGMLIDASGAIRWQTDPTDAGRAEFVSVTVEDEFGATATQNFTLNVAADTVAPNVDLEILQGFVDSAGNFFINQGDTTFIRVTATDDLRVAALELTIDGAVTPVPPSGVVEYQGVAPGSVSIVATATDVAGNVGTSTTSLGVIDPNDNSVPQVEITSPVSSEPHGASSGALHEVTDTVEIKGTVQDDNLLEWRLEYARADLVDYQNFAADGDHWKLINSGNSNVINGALGTFDATVLSNNTYVVRLYASDGVRIRTRGILLAVAGQTKIGNFRLEFTDLQIPLAGIPISVTRVYDTLDADTIGSFGHGWTMGAADPLIFETVPDGGEFVPGQTKVYLTNPDGHRVGFTYTETAISAGLIGDTLFAISFEPDPGVYDTLAIEQRTISRSGASGAFGSIAQALGATLMNPEEYTLTTPTGFKYSYHEDEGLKRITDLNGNFVTFTQDAITHSSGDEITFVRSAGRVDEINFPSVDVDGNPTTATLNYQYDANGDLTLFTDAAGVSTGYEYEANPAHFLKRAINDAGETQFRVVYEEKDNVFRFLHVEDRDGNILQLSPSPDLLAQQAVVRDGNGNETTLKFDDRGNVLEEQDAHGNTIFREYNDPNNPDLETRIVDRLGFVAEREYDANGNVRFIRELGPENAPFANPIVTEFQYDSGNRVELIKNAMGYTTQFDYDANGNLEWIVNNEGHYSTFTYDAQGRRETFTDFNKNTTRFEYTTGDQPNRVIFADGTYQVFEYNSYGQVTLEEFFEADGTPVERRATQYDASGRVVAEISGAEGDPDHPPTVVRKFYDGHLLDWEIIVHPDSVELDGTLRESPATPVHQRKSSITDFEYDSNDRLIWQVDAEGGRVDFRYDAQGNRIALRDPVGNITTWVYDELNRVVEERDPLYWDNVRSTDQAFMSMSDDEFLELVAPVTPISPFNDTETRDPLYDDSSGASCGTQTGAEHVRLTCYDADGNQTHTIDRNNRMREFDYDHAGRLLQEIWYSPPAPGTGVRDLVETITFTYDVLGNMETASDSNSNYLFTYDTLNRLDTVDNNPDGTRTAPRVILDYDYDPQGNVVLTSDDAGVTVESDYDQRNRLEWRKWFDADASGDVDDARVDFTYNAAGREATIHRYSDLLATTLVGNTIRTYDLAGRSDLLRHNNSSGALLAAYNYDYNSSGLLIAEERSHQEAQFAQTVGYVYDLTGQVTEALFSGQFNERYTYDLNGNRKTSEVGGDQRTYTAGAANRLQNDRQYRYEYDGEGNQIKRVPILPDGTDDSSGTVRTFIYDHRNRLVRANDWSSDPGDPKAPIPGVVILESVLYTYDVFGDRIAQTQSGVTIHSIYDGGSVWADAGLGTDWVRYLFGDDVDNLLGQNENTQTRWHLSDNQRTVRDIVDSTGTLADHTEYSSFGAVIGTSLVHQDRFAFTGREFDGTTGLYYYRARAYDPQTGRFQNQDPLSFDAGDANLYRYGANAPGVYRDPTGTVSTSEYASLVSRLSQVAAQCAKSLVSGAIVGEVVELTIYIYFTTNGQPYIGRTIQELSARERQHLAKLKKQGLGIVEDSTTALFRGSVAKGAVAQVEQAFLEEADNFFGRPTNLLTKPKKGITGVLKNRIRAAAKFADPC